MKKDAREDFSQSTRRTRSRKKNKHGRNRSGADSSFVPIFYFPAPRSLRAPRENSSRRLTWHKVLLCTVLFASGISFAISALAQKSSASPSPQTPPAADEKTIQSDPLRCWLKSTKTSVHVGEQFNVAITCAVIETQRVSVVPDVSQIEPASIQLAPFEVLSGLRHPDIKSGMWRYFQYEYTVRLIADGFFGQDLALPPINLSYRVNMTGAGAAQEGREKTYVLPQLPIRIVSLVPVIATDIRDAARDTFADIAERNFHATVAFVIAGILYAFAAVLVLIMLVRAFGKLRQRTPVAEGTLQPAAVVGASLGTLGRIGKARDRDGWTNELIGQSVAVMRIAGALAMNRPVAQIRAAHDSVLQDGQLLMSRGWFKRGSLLVSASATPRVLGLVATRPSWPDRRPLYAEVQEALNVFSEARYARETVVTAAELDRAMERVRTVLRQLRLQLSWPMRTLSEWFLWLQSRRGPGWAR